MTNLSVTVTHLFKQWNQACIEPRSGERACNSWIAKYLLLLKLEVTPTNCRRWEKRAVAIMTKQPSRLRQSHFSTACSFLSVCLRYKNPLLLFVFFQVQAWGVGYCDSFSYWLQTFSSICCSFRPNAFITCLSLFLNEMLILATGSWR